MQNTLVSPVGILGFGVEGQSSLRYLFREGVKDIVVMDKNPVTLPDVPAGVNVKVSSGENYLDGLKDCVTVIRFQEVRKFLTVRLLSVVQILG